jgi:hypothetical protein
LTDRGLTSVDELLLEIIALEWEADILEPAEPLNLKGLKEEWEMALTRINEMFTLIHSE